MEIVKFNEFFPLYPSKLNYFRDIERLNLMKLLEKIEFIHFC
jgi:hypothetical protein